MSGVFYYVTSVAQIVIAIAAIAAIAAFYATWRQAKTTEHSLNLTRQAFELEKRREEQRTEASKAANLYAYTDTVLIEYGKPSHSTMLVITNDGPASAKNVRIGYGTRSVGLPVFGSHATTRWVVTENTGSLIHVHIEWQDEADRHRLFDADLAVVAQHGGSLKIEQ